MARIAYEDKNFRAATLDLISHANTIIKEYRDDGYVLTLRQLYYQFVARGLVENSERSYKNLGAAISNGRLAGLIDWYAIEDRTRNLARLPHWDSPASILDSCARQYRVDKWADGPTRVEIWVEKEALAGVVAGPAEEYDVPYFCCRGYVSQSEQWSAAQRFREYARKGQEIVLLYLGDHDPSGIDMTRDVTDRISLFMRDHFAQQLTVDRIALNMPQIEELKPPPNPAKMTDSRFGDYLRTFGDESWELDALNPRYLTDLIIEKIRYNLDDKSWNDATARETSGRAALSKYADMERNRDDE